MKKRLGNVRQKERPHNRETWHFGLYQRSYTCWDFWWNVLGDKNGGVTMTGLSESLF